MMTRMSVLSGNYYGEGAEFTGIGGVTITPKDSVSIHLGVGATPLMTCIFPPSSYQRYPVRTTCQQCRSAINGGVLYPNVAPMSVAPFGLIRSTYFVSPKLFTCLVDHLPVRACRFRCSCPQENCILQQPCALYQNLHQGMDICS